MLQTHDYIYIICSFFYYFLMGCNLAISNYAHDYPSKNKLRTADRIQKYNIDFPHIEFQFNT